MLCGKLVQGSPLLYRSLSSYFIYLRDHNKLIQGETAHYKLSYKHPKNLIPDVPQHKLIHFKL